MTWRNVATYYVVIYMVILDLLKLSSLGMNNRPLPTLGSPGGHL